MAITRVTQNMMTQRSLTGMQTSLSRLAKLQEQLSTGRVLNRPSDSPTGTTSAIQTLPGPVTLAFAPYGKNLGAAVGTARATGHEILLEVPLEPFDYPDSDPGPDTLLTGQAPRDNLDKLYNVMGKFGGYVGIINHMGARFTASAQDFGPVMEELGARGLGYVDDGSSNRSVAPQLAAANQVEFGKADLALDHLLARADGGTYRVVSGREAPIFRAGGAWTEDWRAATQNRPSATLVERVWRPNPVCPTCGKSDR